MLLIIYFSIGVGLSACLDSPCKDAKQLPIPSLNINLVNLKTKKSKFVNVNDTTNYNPDSLVVFVGNKYLIDFTKPFKVAQDSIIRIENWITMDYLYPKTNYLYLQYKRGEVDEIYIEYQSSKKSCDGTNYANFAISRVYFNNIELIPQNSVYTISK